MIGLVLLIGGFHYQVVQNCNDMGAVKFPISDRLASRVIMVCKDVDTNQRLLAAEHELHHICYHNHEHNFATKVELDEHLNHKFTEEESIEIVTPCIVENRAAVYSVFGVSLKWKAYSLALQKLRLKN